MTTGFLKRKEKKKGAILKLQRSICVFSVVTAARHCRMLSNMFERKKQPFPLDGGEPWRLASFPFPRFLPQPKGSIDARPKGRFWRDDSDNKIL